MPDLGLTHVALTARDLDASATEARKYGVHSAMVDHRGKEAGEGRRVHRIQGPTLPVRLRGRIEDKGCDRQVIGTPGPTCEGMHHRGILEHLLQGVLPCVSKARSL